MIHRLLPEVQEHFSRRVKEYTSDPQIDFKTIQGLRMAKVLEVGCGAKFSLSSASEKYGVDITRGLLRELKRRSPEVNLVMADVRYLPFKNRVFDLVTAVFLLHHLVGETTALSRRNIQKGLSEMSRVSGERGCLLILEHLSENKFFSSVFFYVTWVLAKLNLNLEYFDIHDKVVTYYLDETTFRKMIGQIGLTLRTLTSKFWQFRNFRLGQDKSLLALKPSMHAWQKPLEKPQRRS